MKKTRNYNTEEAINMLAANQAVLDVIPDHLEKIKQELAVTLAKFTQPHSKLGKYIRKLCCGDFPPDEYFYNEIEGKGKTYQKISMDEEYPTYTFSLNASASEIGSHNTLFPYEIELKVKPFTFLQREETELEWRYEALIEQYGIDDPYDDVLKGEKGIIHLISSIDNLFAELQNIHKARKENKNHIQEIRSKLSTLESELNWLESELETNLEKLI